MTGSSIAEALAALVAEREEYAPCSPRCESGDCIGCAAADCPSGEPLHRIVDGCPSCGDGKGDGHGE